MLQNEEMGAAACWLVDECEKERGQNIIKIRKSVLLAESEIAKEDQNRRNESEFELKEPSILHPSAICPGRWTLTDKLLTFQNNNNGVSPVLIFSTQRTKVRVLHPEPQKQEKKEDEVA